MAKTLDAAVLAELDNTAERLNADNDYSTGKLVLASADKETNTNFDESIIEDGEELTVPEASVLEKYVFKQALSNNRFTYGVICASNLGGTKKLYLNSFKKRAMPYGDDLKPVPGAQAVRSSCPLSMDMKKCSTVGKMYQLIAGKTIRFKHTQGSPVQTAQFDYTTGQRNITGTRNTSVWDTEII